ncbi:putative proline-rich receptor-like protein kinase PERK6 [Apium graveolens]|uniref:putative proline-rich receptor-like protein kinase PERK6 n=1 Tax=Apium graveolens TaxID=4045 RepID=UPI003D78C5BE
MASDSDSSSSNKNNNNGGNDNSNNNGSSSSNNNNSNNNNNNNNGGNNNSGNNNNGGNNKSPPPPPPPPPPPSPSGRKTYNPPPPHSKENHSKESHSKALSPPHHHKSKASGGMDNNTTRKAIMGGVVGGAALLLLFTIACICCCCRKKKRRAHDIDYFPEPRRNKSNAYYNSGPTSYGINPQSSEHHLKMPQSSVVSSEYGWAVPPPPPPMGHSSDMSSSAFSGPQHPPMPPPHPALALGFNKSTFTYDELAAATGGFAQSKMLGQGGFGFVHKGVLPNGKEIAVKSLKLNSGQGEREFQAEVEIISRVHHRHLVSLVGYCIAGSQRLLVYEFVPNQTLEHHLHGKDVPVMAWSTRMRIAMGSAKGFAYLHEDCHPRIIHRDIKTANILLDEHYEAKVADFGLAKLSNENYTHVSTRIMGTFGYLAPEYASSGKLTEKSDVYSYGVMLLELISGKRPVDMDDDENDTLIDWARPILMRAVEGGDYNDLVDPRLLDNYDADEMLRMVACAAACIRHSARRRPKMSQIVRALEGDVSLEDLHEGVRIGGPLTGSNASSDYEGSYSVDMKKFRKAGGSHEYSSSDYGPSSGESQEMRPNRTRMGL